MRRCAVVLLLAFACLSPAARASGGAADGGTTVDPRLSLVCKPAGRRVRPQLAGATQQVSAGILYQEQVTADQTRLELTWRPVGEPRWTGKSLIPTDVEGCQPLLLEDDGVVVACRPLDDGRSSSGRRLLRLGPGREPVRLAEALPLPGKAHLHPLGGGRLLVWAEAGERGAAQVGSDELIAAELDAGGKVLHQSIVGQPYVRRWPAGRGYLLLRQPPVGSDAQATYWRAEWDLEAHRLVFSPEPARPVPGVCAAAEVAQSVPALIRVRGQAAATGVARLGAGGECVAGVTGPLLPGGGRVELRPEAGRLVGRVWAVTSVARPHPKGGKRRIPRISALAVTCQLW